MKLLFDQNLAPRLVQDLDEHFPGSVHVQDIGLASADDTSVWEHAIKHGMAIVTKDDDFRQRSFLYGSPPKVIWVRLGNCSTSEIATLLRARCCEILEFDSNSTASLMMLARVSPNAAATVTEEDD